MGRTHFASIACVTFLFCSFSSFATHIRGGEITIQKVNGQTYRITLTEYTNLVSPVMMGGGTLDFGDGTNVITDSYNQPPLTRSTGAGAYVFTVLHTYAGAGFYNVSYTEQNYDEGIINFPNSVNVPFTILSGFVIDPFLAPYSPMSFSAEPIMTFEAGNTYSFSTAVVNDSDHIFTYNLFTPDGVNDYVFPENLQINSQTGLVTWDTKFKGAYTPGGYLIGIVVSQFDQNKTFLGYVKRVFELDLREKAPHISLSNPINDPNGKATVLN